jgi:hypothetical protein
MITKDTKGVAFLGVGRMGETPLGMGNLLCRFARGSHPTPGPEDALESLRLALAVIKSWREKRPVKVSEITL